MITLFRLVGLRLQRGCPTSISPGADASRLTRIPYEIRALMAPDLFEPHLLAYWIHFVSAGILMWMATRIMRNRFHSEELEPERSAIRIGESTGTMLPRFWRPRCTDRPFLWKDRYILGGGPLSDDFWFGVSFLALIGTTLAIAAEVSFGNAAALVVAIVLVSMAPWVLALHFDALMAAEFREGTWGSLLLLPVNLLDPIPAKVQAALFARRWTFAPIAVAVAFAGRRHPFEMLITVTIASLTLPILVEVSVLSHFNAKKWWAGAIVAVLVLLLISAVVAVWIIFPPLVSLIVTVVFLSMTIAGFLKHIQWRMRNWIGD